VNLTLTKASRRKSGAGVQNAERSDSSSVFG